MMMMMIPLVYVNIPEVNLGTSSQVYGEEPGQLYAYRVSNNAAYLGTRDNETLGASVGIKMMVGSGMYRCYAQNGNENADAILTVYVRCKFLSCIVMIARNNLALH